MTDIDIDISAHKNDRYRYQQNIGIDIVIDDITGWDSIYTKLNRSWELKTALLNCLPRIINEKKNKKLNTKNKIDEYKKKNS